MHEIVDITVVSPPSQVAIIELQVASVSTGTVTGFSVVTANGVSGVVANATTTPAVTFTLGAITPSSVAASGNVTGANLSGTNTGDQTSVTGNAGTATALATARAINGTNFDGTAPITVTAAAGTLTGSTLNATVTGSSLTSVGTLAGLTSSAAIDARNGATAVPIYAHNTWTDASNYERGVFGFTSNILRIGAEKLGTGTMRSAYLVANSWQVMTGSAAATLQARFEEDVTYLRSWLCLGTTGSNAMAALRGAEAGKIQLLTGVGTNTGFNSTQYGGTTSSFPALKRVGAEFQVVHAATTAATNVAAADSEMGFIEDRYRRKGTGTPEAVVTAPIGAVFHRTDGGAGTSFYVKESGTGNTGWVAK